MKRAEGRRRGLTVNHAGAGRPPGYSCKSSDNDRVLPRGQYCAAFVIPKIRHASRKGARRHLAKLLLQTPGYDGHVFCCRACAGWHVGRKASNDV